MSYLTDTDINKRAGNLYVAYQATQLPTEGLWLRSETADMTYAATYLAAFPAAVPRGGTWDPATAGVGVTLSRGDTVAVFSDTGSVVGTSAPNFTDAPIMWEVQFVTAQDVSATGLWRADLNGTAAYDANDYAGGGGGTTDTSYYEQSGSLVDYAGTQAAPNIAAGDVVGMVIDTIGQVTVWLNGVEIGTMLADGMTVFTRAMATRLRD